MARAGDEIAVIKDVPALICDACGEVEYTLETSKEIDAIMKDFFCGTVAGKAPAGGGDRFQAPASGTVKLITPELSFLRTSA